MRPLLLFALLISSSASASNGITENLTVKALSYDASKKDYLVTFFEKAAFYRADKKLLSCLDFSIKERKPVAITYDPLKLLLSTCRK